MSAAQIIRTPAGEELVVIPKAEYEALLAAADEAGEDAADVAIYDARKRADEAPLPVEVSAAILKGDSRLKAIRKWRGLTQQELAGMSGVTQGFLSDLESGKRAPSHETADQLAHALAIPKAWIEA